MGKRCDELCDGLPLFCRDLGEEGFTEPLASTHAEAGACGGCSLIANS